MQHLQRHNGKIVLALGRQRMRLMLSKAGLVFVKWAVLTVGTLSKVMAVALFFMWAYDASKGSVFLAGAVMALLMAMTCRHFVLYIDLLRVGKR